MYAIDLFCGAGGFSEGILQAGFHIVFSSDKSPYVQQTYMNRHEQLGLVQGQNTHFELSDIKELRGQFVLDSVNNLTYFRERNIEINVGDIDAIFGGPPCQGFSIAGKRDKSDPRNMLFREYLRVIQEIRPKYIVMENVTGFMNMEVNPDFKSFNGIKYGDNELVKHVVQRELTEFGYVVLEPRILDASDYGVPQRRQRAIFLAYREDVVPLDYPQRITPLPEQKLTVLDALKGISIEGTGEYAKQSSRGRTPHFETGNPIGNYENPLNVEESTHSQIIVERFSLFKQGESIAQLKSRLLGYKVNGQTVINFDNYPSLFQDALFNINKQYNIAFIKKILDDNDIENDSKLIAALYKRIIKLWNHEVNSKEFVKEIKKPIGKRKIDKEKFKTIFLLAKEGLNGSVSNQELREWFDNNDPEITNEKNSLFFKVGNTTFECETILNAVLTNKNTRTRLDGNQAGPTMVTLPDDFIHPIKNKILNVREMARIQSFDDSFAFLGKRTTGGEKRKEEVPQFTQVGNAVPPLLAYAIANEVAKAISSS